MRNGVVSFWLALGLVASGVIGCGDEGTEEPAVAADTSVGADPGVAGDTGGPEPVDTPVVPDTPPTPVDGVDSVEPDPTDQGGPAPDTVEPEDPDPACDPLQPSFCALPWPSGKFLAVDATSPTGFRMALGETTLPENSQGHHADPSAWNEWLDGYGVGTPIMVHFPGIDVSKLPTEVDPAGSLDPDGPIALLAVDSEGLATRQPFFCELDLTAQDSANTTLYLRPLVILDEATRYVVAMRNLVDEDGLPIEPSPAFEALRDQTTDGTYLAARQPHFDDLFGLCETVGIARADLVLAWDFVTASSEAMHGRMLHVRDAGFEATGESGAELTITKIEEKTPEEDPYIWLSIEGTFEVPDFTEERQIGELVGYVLSVGEDGMPKQTGTRSPTFWVRVPPTRPRTARPTASSSTGMDCSAEAARSRAAPTARSHTTTS